jgi:hypothetical protein
VLRFSFGVVNWRIEERQKIDGKTREILTMYEMCYPKADIDRLYVRERERMRKRRVAS